MISDCMDISYQRIKSIFAFDTTTADK